MGETGYRVRGDNDDAPFNLTVHRGEGMALLAMNWRGRGRPPRDFVGFGIQFFEPGSRKAVDVTNRLTFEGAPEFGQRQPSMKAPIQKFRWVHFPRKAEKPGAFRYRVTPVFMDDKGKLRHGEAQEAALELRRETHPGVMNVSFTRGFVASQAFVDMFLSAGPMNTLLPGDADEGLTFPVTHPRADEALPWMGFEARSCIHEVLDQAIADPACTVRVVAYDLNEPGILERLVRLGDRLRIVIDDSSTHGPAHSGESQSAKRLAASAGKDNVKRQHMGGLQHNKTIVVDGPKGQKVLCGSTNFSWRGLYVQNNNVVVLDGAAAVQAFGDAFEQYWTGGAAAFGRSGPAADWHDLKLPGVKAKATFSPHGADNGVLQQVADDIAGAQSSVLYSLAFLGQTKGAVRDAITQVTEDPGIFVAGIADQRVGGIVVQTPDGNRQPVHPAALTENVPAPFSAEPTGGSGIRLHHKFVVVDFDKPTARVYLGSYNFSRPADQDNGENLLLVKDRRVATSFAVEAVRIFDHYQFRARKHEPGKVLALRRPPGSDADAAWFDRDYTDRNRILDRKLFA